MKDLFVTSGCGYSHISDCRVAYVVSICRQSTKTVYPTTDPEFSRKASQSDSVPVVNTVARRDREVVTPPPMPVIVPSEEIRRPLSGKHVQDHHVRVETPPRESYTPVDAEGTTYIHYSTVRIIVLNEKSDLKM